MIENIDLHAATEENDRSRGLGLRDVILLTMAAALLAWPISAYVIPWIQGGLPG